MDVVTVTWIHWNGTWIWWMEHGPCCSIWNGTWISNSKDSLSIVCLVGQAIVHSCQRVPCGNSFVNRPTCSSGVRSLVFPIATFVAFGVQTLMRITLLWPDPWSMSPINMFDIYHNHLSILHHLSHINNIMPLQLIQVFWYFSSSGLHFKIFPFLFIKNTSN